MKKIQVRRLTQPGIKNLSDLLANEDKKVSRDDIERLLVNNTLSEPLKNLSIITDGSSDTFWDIAETINEALEVKCYQDFKFFEEDIGLWSWLSLLYWDETELSGRPHNKSARNRVIPVGRSDFGSFSRHLLRTPCLFMVNFGSCCKWMFNHSGKDGRGEYTEQISQKEFYYNERILQIVQHLFCDLKTDKPKPNLTHLIRHLNRVLPQFDVTYDLKTMPIKKVLNLLPTIFDPCK